MEKAKVALFSFVCIIKNWFYKNPQENFSLIFILFIGGFLRLYRISEYMTFLGDEGRDAIIVRNLLVNFDLILIGPGTSIGNMYLGPLYYYLIAPFLLIFNFSPVGPSVMVALFGVVTAFLIWLFVKEVFPCKKGQTNYAALLAAFLYSTSPIVIIYNRSSWNPNIMPFFSLLCVYSIWKIYKNLDFKWLIVLGISFAFVLQSHYLGLLLLPTILLYFLFTFFKAKKDKFKLKLFLKNSIIGFLIFAFLMSPLFIFDARHGWRNFSAIATFFSNRQETVSAKPWNALPKFWPLFENLNSRLIAATDKTGGLIVSWFLVFSGVILLIKSKKKFVLESPYFLIYLWLIFGFIGLGNYKQEIYDHYFGFLFTAPFILFSMLVFNLKKVLPISFFVSAILIFYIFYLHFSQTPLKYPPNKQLQRSIEVANKIISESQGKPFNFAVIAERNYEGAYQYFLEKENSNLLKIDPLRLEYTIAKQLFVVCELPKDKCNPTTNAKAEIANFGWSKVESEWDVSGVTLYKLVHYNN
ncbi:MAG: glycosyltransferase family 39 protein [Patescibacteria group bacterium]|nr:glycosyltransferase family 39 protein [Patescibacteria group bacterium]